MTFFLKPSLLKLLESHVNSLNQIRFYARWTHRQPRRVLTPEEYKKMESNYKEQKQIHKEEQVLTKEEKIIELNPTTDIVKRARNKDISPKSKWAPKNVEKNLGLINMQELDSEPKGIDFKIEQKIGKKKIKSKVMKDKKDMKANTTDMLETVIDADGNFIYTKLQDKDPAVSQLLLTVKSRNEQIKKDLALLEGKRLIKDALQGHCQLKNLIFSRKSDVEFLKPYLPKSGAKIYKMPYREIQMWSDLTTTPGIMGIFKTPDVQTYVSKDSMIPLTIICDNIREPGNLGAVLRTAAGVGAQSVVLTKGCVDLWDTKVLRSACGAHFHVQIHKKMEWSDIEKSLDNMAKSVFIADNKIVTESIPNEMSSNSADEQSLKDIVLSMPLVPYYGVQFGDFKSLVLIVGGETEGISEESYRFAKKFNGVRLNIPLNNNVESLNTGTAIGIIMFEMKKQLLQLNSKNEVCTSVK